MIVNFKKLFCNGCQKERWHEIVVTPSCVCCHEYNLTQPEAEIEIERFIG